MVSLSSASLKVLCFEKPLFAKRVISILDASSDEQLERALPCMEEWPYTIVALRLADDKLFMCGDSIVDCQTITVFSALKNRVIKEVERSDKMSLALPLDDACECLSDDPLNQVFNFLVWIIRNPKGTTLEAKEAGKLEFLKTCE